MPSRSTPIASAARAAMSQNAASVVAEPSRRCNGYSDRPSIPPLSASARISRAETCRPPGRQSAGVACVTATGRAECGDGLQRGAFAGMRQVDQHAEPVHLPHHLAPHAGEAGILRLRPAAAEQRLVVVGELHDADAEIVQHLRRGRDRPRSATGSAGRAGWRCGRRRRRGRCRRRCAAGRDQVGMVAKAPVPGDDVVDDGAERQMIGDGGVDGAEPRLPPLRRRWCATSWRIAGRRCGWRPSRAPFAVGWTGWAERRCRVNPQSGQWKRSDSRSGAPLHWAEGGAEKYGQSRQIRRCRDAHPALPA